MKLKSVFKRIFHSETELNTRILYTLINEFDIELGKLGKIEGQHFQKSIAQEFENHQQFNSNSNNNNSKLRQLNLNYLSQETSPIEIVVNKSKQNSNQVFSPKANRNESIGTLKKLIQERADTGKLIEIEHAKIAMNLNPVQQLQKTRQNINFSPFEMKSTDVPRKRKISFGSISSFYQHLNPNVQPMDPLNKTIYKQLEQKEGIILKKLSTNFNSTNNSNNHHYVHFPANISPIIQMTHRVQMNTDMQIKKKSSQRATPIKIFKNNIIQENLKLSQRSYVFPSFHETSQLRQMLIDKIHHRKYKLEARKLQNQSVDLKNQTPSFIISAQSDIHSNRNQYKRFFDLSVRRNNINNHDQSYLNYNDL
ncbi:UNKNOWN [Stylonychia lemnae]|uniref:Uncharacterized protein n=1 Tax=Stylonychia lemnae TaxID=5949 RepID=A0A078AAA9_STYLE|nr:UNKNOWN [Stylonychia lemnae]|eukprot:CDW79129.1 UNKNOWN [Stylonychia lemnae]